jgi:hypothetical protein
VYDTRAPSKDQRINADKAWQDLTYIADLYFMFDGISYRYSIEPLEELATALSQACASVEKLGRNGDIDALYNPWRAETNMTLKSALASTKGSNRIIEDVMKALRSLSTLDAVARRAVNDVRRKGGRPRGSSKLPSAELIAGLAAVYRNNTGLRPTATKDKPFVSFVYKFLVALDRKDISQARVPELIKRRRRQALRVAKAREICSPFARG